MTHFNVQDSVAFVTGTNKKRGIGRAIVRSLLTHGAKKVYATARHKEQLDDLLAEFSTRVEPVALDLTDEHAIAELGWRYSDVNLLVNNAGVFAGQGALGDLEGASLELAVNYLAPLLVTRSFAPTFARHAARGDGKASAVVNINSIASLVSFPLGGTYSASKAAAHSLTQAQRRDLPGSLVIGVYPGPIDTEMADGVPMDKSAPSVVGEAIVEALLAGQEDVFPDPTAQQIHAGWQQDAKALERNVSEQAAAE